MLLDSLEAQASPLTTDIDTGSLYGDVTALATELIRYFLDPAGWTTVRISIDAKAFAPHLSDVDARITAPILAMSTAIFNRGIARAEIAESVSPRTAAEKLMHVIALEPEPYPDARAHPGQHVLPLVHILLTGIGAELPADAESLT